MLAVPRNKQINTHSHLWIYSTHTKATHMDTNTISCKHTFTFKHCVTVLFNLIYNTGVAIYC